MSALQTPIPKVKAAHGFLADLRRQNWRENQISTAQSHTKGGYLSFNLQRVYGRSHDRRVGLMSRLYAS